MLSGPVLGGDALADGRVLRGHDLAGLDEGEALSEEAELPALSGVAAPAADAGVVGLRLHLDAEPGGPGDDRVRVDADVLLGRDLHHQRLPGGHQGDLAAAGDVELVLAGAGDAVLAVDGDDLRVEGRVERQDVGAVDGEALLLDLHDVDVLREVGEVDRALPGAAHQVEALAGAGAGPALVRGLVLAVEVDEALVGDHGALAGEDVVLPGQADPQELRVLDDVPLLALLLGVVEKRALHGVFSLPLSPGPAGGRCCPRSAVRRRCPGPRRPSGTPRRCPVR